MSVLEDITDQETPENQSATFRCRIQINYPEISLTWYKGSQRLDQDHKYEKSTVGDLHCLKVNNCDPSDEGDYRVVCGPHISTATLAVTGKCPDLVFSCFVGSYFGEIGTTVNCQQALSQPVEPISPGDAPIFDALLWLTFWSDQDFLVLSIFTKLDDNKIKPVPAPSGLSCRGNHMHKGRNSAELYLSDKGLYIQHLAKAASAEELQHLTTCVLSFCRRGVRDGSSR